MLLILFISCIPHVFSQSIYDAIVGSIHCSCDRETGLDVSKTKVHFTNYATDGKEQSSYIGDAAATILNSGGLSTNQCVDILIPGYDAEFTNNNLFDNAKCVYSQIQCNGNNSFSIIIDHYEYTSNRNGIFGAVTDYKEAVKFVKSIGQSIGKMVVDLFTSKQVDPSYLRILGHSLGCHMAGYAGVYVKNKSSFTVARIDGADIAGPCYDDCPDEHLQSGNADIVVAYHCTQALGSIKSMSDYDFFSNDGKDQSGCPRDILYGEPGASCSHKSCLAIALLPAIKNDIWVATNCPSYDEYKSGKCDGNEQTLAGYRVAPVGPNGTYYFSSSDYNCSG